MVNEKSESGEEARPEPFSHRMGITEPRSTLQRQGMDEALRNSIWNEIRFLFTPKTRGVGRSMTGSGGSKKYTPPMVRAVWTEFLKQPRDTLPDHPKRAYNAIYDSYQELSWDKIYDLLQFILWKRGDKDKRAVLRDNLNDVLERELSAYRIVGTQVVPVTEEHELDSLEESLDVPDRFEPVRTHLQKALSIFANRSSPDYTNVVKESVLAVESALRVILDEPEINVKPGLAELEKAGVEIPGAIEASIKSLYGYASAEQGIRHGRSAGEVESASQDEARMALVTSSAFANYIISKAISEGLVDSG